MIAEAQIMQRSKDIGSDLLRFNRYDVICTEDGAIILPYALNW